MRKLPLGFLARIFVRCVPAGWVRLLVSRIIPLSQSRLDPPDALRFLLELDGQIYRLTNARAVEYGEGVHPKHRQTRYHEFFITRIKSGEKVLELGCGNGALAFDIAEKTGAQVSAIDLSSENIAEAKRRFPHARIEYRVGDALKDLPDETFDAVILSNVLEHLDRRPEFLRRIAETIRPRHVLIRIPLFERDWRVPLKKELGIDWRLDATHETEYSAESFHEELRNAGLSLLHEEIRWGEIWAEVGPAEVRNGPSPAERRPFSRPHGSSSPA